jgi:hypothetical protein
VSGRHVSILEWYQWVSLMVRSWLLIVREVNGLLGIYLLDSHESNKRFWLLPSENAKPVWICSLNSEILFWEERETVEELGRA